MSLQEADCLYVDPKSGDRRFLESLHHASLAVNAGGSTLWSATGEVTLDACAEPVPEALEPFPRGTSQGVRYT